MKITLENFRCHSKKTFELPDKGLIALSGKKGKGKTSLLQAIVFAFFGECSVKPLAHGSKNCKVTLDYHSMHIVRSHRPSPHRLFLQIEEEEYTDDTAQSIIEKVIGLNYEEFMASSYIVQRSHNSVISMTPADQLRFIEKLSFMDADRQIYQKRFKEKVKECQENISYIEGKIESLTDHLQKERSRLPSPPQDNTLSENIPSLSELRSSERNIRSSLVENEKKLKKNQEELQKIKKEAERKHTILEQKKILDFELEQYRQKIAELGEIYSDADMEKKQKEIISLQTNIDYMKKYKSYMEAITTATSIRADTIEKLKKDMENLKIIPEEETIIIQKELEDLLEKERQFQEERELKEREKFFRESAEENHRRIIQEVKTTFTTVKTEKSHLIVTFLHKKTQTLTKEIAHLEETIQFLQKTIAEKELCGDVLDCPKCKTKLQYSNGELKVVEKTKIKKEERELRENPEEKLSQKVKEIASTRKLKADVDEWLKTLKSISELISKNPVVVPEPFDKKRLLQIRDTLSENQHKYSHYQKLQKELDALTSENPKLYPVSIRKLFEEAEDRKSFLPKRFEPFENIYKMEEDLVSLKEEFSENRKKINSYNTLSKEITLRETKLNTIHTSLSKTSFLHSPEKSAAALEEEYHSIRKINTELMENLEKIHTLISISTDYLSYQKDVERIAALSQEIDQTKEELTIQQRFLEGALGLMSSDKEAQILSLKTTISKINSYAEYYLRKIFDDEPISVTLHSHKLSQKGDAVSKINTVIEYRGDKYNSFGELCGGESQQCELAFLFGVNDMLGSNIVFLDECVNNLDGETNMKTINVLKKIAGNKLILIIAHEAVLGVFDEVIYF